MNLEKVVARLVEKVERRFFGKYRGLVVDNADPERLGRLRVRVPSVLGENIVTGWALPCAPYGGDANQGFLFVPEVGAGVWVEFEEGDLEFPVWVGTFWSKPGGDSELPKPNKPDGSEDAAVQDPPTRKIIKTKTGNTIQFEDKEGEESVQIAQASKGNVLTIDKKGIKFTDTNGNEITMDDQGLSCRDKNGSEIVMDSSGVTIKSTQIKLGENASSEKLVLGTTLINQLLTPWHISIATHTHVGNMGAPTSPPTPPLQPPGLATALSQKHLVE